MFKTRKKLANLAVVAALSGSAMMVAAPAHALNESQNNLGQVLLFPYYTVKQGLDTVFTVTNTTDKTAVIKVRFREALNSREVRDFNVVLSPYDHWSAGITKDVSGNGAVVRTFDKSCTSPPLPASTAMPGSKEVDFTNYLFSDASAARVPGSPGGRDGASSDLSRVQEGYFEVFLMGVSTQSTDTLEAITSANKVEYFAKHVSGTPRDCSVVDQAFLSTSVIASNFSRFTAPQNILKGHVTYLNAANGQSFDAEPTAIESWYNGTAQGDHVIKAPGDDAPNLSHGNDSWARGLADGSVYQVQMSSALNAASAVLSRTQVINEYVSGTGTATSWIVTFPTKHHYTDWPRTVALAPFAETFHKGWPVTTTDGAAGKSCDSISFVHYDREETFKTGTRFSPIGTGTKICYEANVLDFNGSTLFGSGTNHIGVSTTDVGTAGWSRLSLTNTGTLAQISTTGSFVGLPVIGFAAVLRGASSTIANYGSSIEHAYYHGYRP